MPTNDANKGGYSSDKYSAQSREYFDNERRKNDEFWKRQGENRAKSEEMKASQARGREALRQKQQNAPRASEKLRQIERPDNANRTPVMVSRRLGGGRDVGRQRAVGAAQEQAGEQGGPEKLGGVLFWMTGGLAIIKDLVIDVLANAGVSLGLGMSATIALAVIGIPIAVLAWSVKMLFAVTVWLIMWVYFHLHGGIHATVRIKRFVIWFIAIIIEFVPYADILPATTTMFFLVAFLENAVRKKNLIGFAARTAINARERKVRPKGTMLKETYEMA